MKQFWVCVAVFVISVGTGSCACDNATLAARPYVRLISDLFCGYNSRIIPSKRGIFTTTKQVSLTFYGGVVKLDDYGYDSVRVAGYVLMSWTDDFLKWNASQYGGISSIQGGDFDIWKPDIVSYDQGVTKFYKERESLKADRYVISNAGNVSFWGRLTVSGSCLTDLYNWPYDAVNCSIILGVPDSLRQIIAIRYSNQLSFSLQISQDYKDWRVVEAKQGIASRRCRYRPKCPVLLSLILQRHSALYSACIVVPLIVLSLVCLVPFWLKDLTFRFILHGLVLGSTVIYMLVFYLLLDHHGIQRTLLLTFSCVVLVFTSLGFVLSTFNHTLLLRNVLPPPDVLTAYAHFVNVRDENSDTEEEVNIVKEKEGQKIYKKWKLVARVLDRVTFLLTAFVFLIFYLRIMFINSAPQ